MNKSKSKWWQRVCFWKRDREPQFRAVSLGEKKLFPEYSTDKKFELNSDDLEGQNNE